MPGCCGTPAGSSKDEKNRDVKHSEQIISQQPGVQPDALLSHNSFKLPTVPSPPPAFSSVAPNEYGQNGYQPQLQQSWSSPPSSPPPNMSQYNAYSSGSPPPPPAAYNGAMGGVNGSIGMYGSMTSQSMMSNSQLPLRANSASPYMPSNNSQTITTTSPVQRNFSPPADEGKMSVSIDFGMSSPDSMSTSYLRLQTWNRYHILRNCTCIHCPVRNYLANSGLLLRRMARHE